MINNHRLYCEFIYLSENELDDTNINKMALSQMITAYLMLRDTPDIYFSGSDQVLEYDYENDKNIDYKDERFHIQQSENTPKWNGMSNPNVHEKLTDQGYTILYNDKNSSITNLSGKYSATARSYIRTGCTAPDYDAASSNPNIAYTALSQTRQCLQRAQRTVAGLEYRFLSDTGRLY